jgi:maltose alpha-D-glucosyltransferase/alpha-amylase
VKFIHQPSPGSNLEQEFSRHLTDTAHFNRVPKFLGNIDFKIGGQSATFALIEEAIPNQGDGWQVTLAYLDRLIKQVGLVSGSKQEDRAEDDYYALLAERLGARTGELHNALAIKTGDDRFDPLPVAMEDRDQWIENATQMLHRAAHNIQQIHISLSPSARAKSDIFLAQRDRYEMLLHHLLPKSTNISKTRVHGDYHLGQVLVSDNDFYIIDFEGEPARTIEERRRKTSPIKDVASMIRSFDYAGATALQTASFVGEKNHPVVEQLVAEWRRKAEQAFLGGYRTTTQTEDGLETQDALLRFFKLDKTLYEIVYESQHRPTWLEIPLTTALDYLKEEGK